MNAGRLAVNFGGMEGLSGEIATAVSNLRNRLDTLEADLAPLRSDWEGDAKTAYSTAKAKWDQAVTDLNNTLAQTGGAVTDSAAAYRHTESRNTDLFPA